MKLVFLEFEQVQTLKKKQPPNPYFLQNSEIWKETWLLCMVIQEKGINIHVLYFGTVSF